MSFILLIGAGLMIRSFVRLQEVESGLQYGSCVDAADQSEFLADYSDRNSPILVETILRKVRSTSGVVSAGLASNFPFSPSGIVSGPGNVSFEIEGKPVSRGELAPQVDTDGRESGLLHDDAAADFAWPRFHGSRRRQGDPGGGHQSDDGSASGGRRKTRWESV